MNNNESVTDHSAWDNVICSTYRKVIYKCKSELLPNTQNYVATKAFYRYIIVHFIFLIVKKEYPMFFCKYVLLKKLI